MKATANTLFYVPAVQAPWKKKSITLHKNVGRSGGSPHKTKQSKKQCSGKLYILGRILRSISHILPIPSQNLFHDLLPWALCSVSWVHVYTPRHSRSFIDTYHHDIWARVMLSRSPLLVFICWKLTQVEEMIQKAWLKSKDRYIRTSAALIWLSIMS